MPTVGLGLSLGLEMTAELEDNKDSQSLSHPSPPALSLSQHQGLSQ